MSADADVIGNVPGTTQSLVEAGFPILLADGRGSRMTRSMVYDAKDGSAMPEVRAPELFRAQGGGEVGAGGFPGGDQAGEEGDGGDPEGGGQPFPPGDLITDGPAEEGFVDYPCQDHAEQQTTDHAKEGADEADQAGFGEVDRRDLPASGANAAEGGDVP